MDYAELEWEIIDLLREIDKLTKIKDKFKKVARENKAKAVFLEAQIELLKKQIK